MFIAALVAVGVITVPLTHGRWSHLAAFRPRGSWLLWIALVVQLLQFTVLDLGPASDAVHLGTYLLAALFLLANRDVPGVWLVALGGLSNGLTIAVNGGTLPARLGALQGAGLPVDRDHFVNSGVMAHAHLTWLGDVFYVPKGVPLANVFSVGDVLLVLGAFVVVHTLARRVPAPAEPGETDESPRRPDHDAGRDAPQSASAESAAA
jgi:Family of unknown function (DUF5317)